MAFFPMPDSWLRIAWHGMGFFLIGWAILTVFARPMESDPGWFSLFFQMVHWLVIFWDVLVGIVLILGLLRPFGWLAAIATFFGYIVVFFGHALWEDQPLFGIEWLNLSNWQGMGLFLLAWALAIGFQPPKSELMIELRYLLPERIRNQWFGPS